MAVAEVRPESDALPVHDANSIKSNQSEGASDKMDGKDEAAEMVVSLRCQDTDAMLENCAAENVIDC